MKIRIAVALAAALLGLATGKSSLISSQSISPPVDLRQTCWGFGGTLVAMVFVVGLQIIRRNPKHGEWAIFTMFVFSLYFFSSGLSAFVISQEISPPSLFFLAIGSGALIGVGISLILYWLRHVVTR